VRVLLDTHSFLWMQAAPQLMGSEARALVEDGANELLLSAASSWEMAIKYRLGKLVLPQAPDVYVPSRIAATGVTALPVEHSHALRVVQLPKHHRDPFDRLLIATAQVEGVPILTADRIFAEYGVDVLAAD
jgi:PIN domain nuclease of toxin-antitoxin system